MFTIYLKVVSKVFEFYFRDSIEIIKIQFNFLQAIQSRLSGTMNFDKTWMEFKSGFGVPKNAYWIGK